MGDPFGVVRELEGGANHRYYSLRALEDAGVGPISRLPMSMRVVLESVLRHCGSKSTEAQVREVANWKAIAQRTEEIPFVVSRIVLQDFTGVPLLVDLAAMRSAVQSLGKSAGLIEPLVPVDLVVDHSVQVDFFGGTDSLQRNMALEFERNAARYEFLKWGMQAFNGFGVVPPGIGIVHQVNLERLAKGVLVKDGVAYPDSLVGTDSHTTMINGLGIVGWGVGGIEAEAGMLGQPVYFLTPDVVGVELTGELKPGVTATDLVLSITELLRKVKVVGKFVEFFGEGAASLSVTDRATIANMAPEYGATMGYFPVDEKTCEYLDATGRDAVTVDLVRDYFTAQGMFGIPRAGEVDYSEVVPFDLGSVVPSVAGPKRPQDRIPVSQLKPTFSRLLSAPTADGGYGKSPVDGNGLKHGDVVIAAITSCTNTSNPSVMLAAGLVAKKAVEAGLTKPGHVKSSLAPGSRVVTEYLERTGLQGYLNQIGFATVGYGCTTCIGNSGPLPSEVEDAVLKNDLVVASVLSGNRNFEARVHQNVKANFLMSPPLVVAYALAGKVEIDFDTEPIGTGAGGKKVYLKDLWPTREELSSAISQAQNPRAYTDLYGHLESVNPLWNEVKGSTGQVYAWDRGSTYIQEPPFFEDLSLTPQATTQVTGARALAIVGDSVTTDHISPAGSIKPNSPAGRYLMEKGVPKEDFNSYGSRRGNHEVMMRGTFANVRIRNLMAPGTEGGVTLHQPSGEQMDIYDAAMRYEASGIPLVILAGEEYGTGSSRDWAAKGTALLGVRAVVAKSFERIHRSNLVMMGVLPLQFAPGEDAASLGLDGTEVYDLDLVGQPTPRQQVTLSARRQDGSVVTAKLTLRIDTPVEVEYYQHGGILPFVLRQLVAAG